MCARVCADTYINRITVKAFGEKNNTVWLGCEFFASAGAKLALGSEESGWRCLGSITGLSQNVDPAPRVGGTEVTVSEEPAPLDIRNVEGTIRGKLSEQRTWRAGAGDGFPPTGLLRLSWGSPAPASFC